MTVRALTTMVVLLVGLNACSTALQPSPSTLDSESVPPSSGPPSPNATATPNAMANPVINGNFAVAPDGRTLWVTCWGEGSPTIVLEAGIPSGGIEQFVSHGGSFTSRLAARTRTCAYNRAGYGNSDPPPNEPRDLDDVTSDLHNLLVAAEIEGPYVLVGSSGGGMIVTYYAAHYPDGINGVVLLDVPAPSATLSLAEAPELAWDSPTNPEHLDIVAEFENRLANEQFQFAAPLIVITATRGQSNVEDQSFWLDWSPTASQIELDGEHTIYNDQPGAVTEQIFSLLQ